MTLVCCKLHRWENYMVKTVLKKPRTKAKHGKEDCHGKNIPN